MYQSIGPCQGYIITDPLTGEGSYKISGGGNGGWFVITSFLALAVLTLLPALALMMASSFTTIGVLFAIFSVYLGIDSTNEYAKNLNVISHSGCTDDEKNKAVSGYAFIHFVELLASYLLFSKIVNTDPEYLVEMFEIYDAVVVGGGSFLLDQLGSLNLCQ